MNIANKLTLARVILVFVFMFVMWSPFMPLNTALWIGLVIFIVASFTDFLDGYLARKHNLVTNLGKFMDPLADKMLVCAAMIAIVDLGPLPAGTLPGWIVVFILLREFAVSGIRLVAAAENTVIAANKLGKIKTVTQMLMIIAFMIPIEWMPLSILAMILAYAALILTIVSGAEYIWQNKEVIMKSK
ncbi:MAG: CDP-diacylglycerol--glycerol-3-phosphate 3-phosphatidyltransferase [Cellulosilyticaceae bacterium]